MEFFNKLLNTVRSSYGLTFGLGLVSGMCFECLKINLSVNGISFYVIFNERQVKKELQKFEKQLKEFDIAAAGNPQIPPGS